MNEMDLEVRLRQHYRTFTPDYSGRAIARVEQAVAERRAVRRWSVVRLPARPGYRGAGALIATAAVVVLVVALVPALARFYGGPNANGTSSPATRLVDSAGMTRDGVLWAVRGNGLSISSDHGRTWSEHQLPPSLDLNLTRPVVVDADHAWYLGDVATASGIDLVVYRTSDGGATWQKPNVGPAAISTDVQLRFVDARVGFLIQGGESLFSSRESITRTLDGGVTWATVGDYPRLYSGPEPSASGGYGDTYGYPGGTMESSCDPVVPADQNTLWVYAQCLLVTSEPSVPLRTHPLLRVSRDSGITWSDVSLPGIGNNLSGDLCIPDGDWGGLVFLTPSEGYVAVSERLTSGSRMHYFRTTDDGRSWAQIAVKDWPQRTMAPIYIDSTHWYQPGLTSGIGVSNDGGQTWTTRSESLGPVDTLWMTADGHGATLIVEGQSQSLYLTSDGGETWAPANLAPAHYPAPTQTM